MYIALAGNIGSGKTTLTKLLAKHFDWKAEYDDVNNNPYLSSFYEDMQRWSFNLQIFFLNLRLKSIVDLPKRRKTVIMDRSIYEDAYIFAPNLCDMGLLAARDYNNYLSLFELVTSFVPPPELLIFIKASTNTLVSQIQKRGRKYETSLRLDYLQNLNDKYNQWASTYSHGKILTINADDFNFADKEEDFQKVAEMVHAALSSPYPATE